MRIPLTSGIVGSFLLILSASGVQSGEVSGPFAKSISASDLVQIKAAVARQRRLSHNVKKIEAVRPDKVSIQTVARTGVDEDTTYDFNAYKRAGTWTIDEGSIQLSVEYRDFRTNGPIFIR